MSARSLPTKKFNLSENDVPKYWYNISADLPKPCPPLLHPGTKKPLTPDDLTPLFAPELVKQELNTTDRFIKIPDEVLEAYMIWRPTPVIRAYRLEKELGTPAQIYYKYEGVAPAGSHKSNTALPQAYYNKLAGTKNLSTETGAGQWGSALSHAGSIFGLNVDVYQVAVSYHMKPQRRTYMQSYGAHVYPSPSDRTDSGKKFQSVNPDGSLGIAISEAVEAAVKGKDTKYCLGSVLNHVMLHQTVIGQEAIKQMKMAGEYPDIVIGCAGGGSNFSGISFPFVGQVLRKEYPKPLRVIAVEPLACPSLTKGRYAYDFGDSACLTPLIKSHTLGHNYMPGAKHVGGLRYHAMAPLVSHLKELGLIEAQAFGQRETFEAGLLFAKTEGIIPAPESCHAVKCAIEEAKKCKQTNKPLVILFNLSGHGYFDMISYEKYLDGSMPPDTALDVSSMEKALAELPQVQLSLQQAIVLTANKKYQQ